MTFILDIGVDFTFQILDVFVIACEEALRTRAQRALSWAIIIVISGILLNQGSFPWILL